VPRGGLLVSVSDVAGILGIAVMMKDRLDPAVLGKALCGKACAIEWFNRRLDRLMGIEPVFSVERAMRKESCKG
jgi:hypothetical protein